MTIKETIWQLEDLRKDREGFLEKDEPDSVFADDIEAIDVAIKALKENVELNRLRAGYEKQKSINCKLVEDNRALVNENAELKKRLDRMSRTKVNHEIKNPFAFTSGLCCPHCDHKDEYILILDLEDENAKLKRLLRLAAEDIGRMIFFNREAAQRALEESDKNG